MSTLHALCKQFDSESNVPVTTSAHTTRSDTSDMQKVVSAVSNNLLNIIPGRRHNMYKTKRLNPSWNWDKDTIDWIEKKKKDFIKFWGMTATDAEEDVEEEEEIDESSDPWFSIQFLLRQLTYHI